MLSIARTGRVLRRPYQRVAFSKRSTAGGINLNSGLLTNQERGDAFTEPQVYHSKNNITAQLKTGRKEQRLLSAERWELQMDRLKLDVQTEEGLRRGTRLPLQRAEIETARTMDAEIAEGHSADTRYSSSMRALMQHEVDRRDHVLDKIGQPPTAREFYSTIKKLRGADDDEGVIDKFHKRLVEEHGIYPTSRVDAYMLDDDSMFPEWVKALPYRIRDRVKYGSLGLTEEDEALRVRLGRIPIDKRLQEWNRLKAAKTYRAAHEETLSLTELRDARQGKRRFHWLQRKRQKRAAQLRRLALRKPDGYEVWPSSAVDYSQRIAFIAQHVENGVLTNGQWPLDAAALVKEKIKRKQEESERTFLLNAEEKKLSQRKMHGSVREMLHSLDKVDKPFKRLSRKVYANRVNAIVHGDQDEHGRRYRRMHSMATRRLRPYDSVAEMALEKEVRKEPSTHSSGLNRTENEHWPKHETSWVDGMPSTRYAT